MSAFWREAGPKRWFRGGARFERATVSFVAHVRLEWITDCTDKRMPIRLTFLASIVCVLHLVTPRSALAQAPIDSAGWLLSPMLGLALDEDADPSLTVAAALGYSLTNAIAVEGELGHVFDMAPGDSDVD